jgi:tetratricopeptide (TPR) repeat protein
MASIDFNLFTTLWEKVKEKFVAEKEEPFTLENLNSRGLGLKQTVWDKINEKFERDETPSDINIPNATYKALCKYLEIERLTDIDGISEEIKRTDDKSGVAVIGFLGRKDELNDLNNFLAAPERRILELYGLPMIGKTELINHFLDKSPTVKSYKIIRVRFNPEPEDPELKLHNLVFGSRPFNDFSDFSANTLMVIENFEWVLRWTGRSKELHDIQDKYSKIKAFLQEVINVGTIKLIIESRFKIHFHSILPNAVPWPVESFEIKGVKREEFWRFYRAKRFTRAQFEQLCNNFNDHTGLIAVAYNDDFIYRDLIDALHRPEETTRYLWDVVEDIVRRLNDGEILGLCALTLMKEPTDLDSLRSYLVAPEAFKDEFEVADALRSLEKKLLIRVRHVLYELNPYIREVCFTFLTNTRKEEMRIISNLPYFRLHGETPVYNRIHQASERGDYMYLITLGKELRKSGRYEEALEVNEAGLPINPRPQYVLNEMAICYKALGQTDEAMEVWRRLKTEYRHLPAFRELATYYRENNRPQKAIEILEEARRVDPKDVITLRELAVSYSDDKKKAIGILEEARRVDPKDVRTLTELAIRYSDNKEYEQSIEAANKAISLGDNFCYVVLANTYQRMGDLEKAYQTAQKGVETVKGSDARLVEKLRELDSLTKQAAIAASKPKPLRVFFSYSRRDEEIKKRIDTYLASLKREGKIETWNDERIHAGDEWDENIKAELRLADIILLLISQDFIQSEYIWNIELPIALDRHRSGEATVIPIFCREIDDFSEMPFAGLNGLPKNARPINSPDNDSALSEVARGIRNIVVKLLEERSH